MKHIIIGTAGHIDHGKTTLVKALTGRSTDRLQEEIKRGISIDLGFTYFDLQSGIRAGVVDVPGHERFIKNMLAGACGIDLVLLTVAANEGIKPQTIEHIDILSYLNIKKSLIVLTKASIADEILIEIITDDIREKTAGTCFENAEIITVDSLSGHGIPELIKYIEKAAAEVPPRNITATPRLSIDRIFSLKGFGTVVTGTLAEGRLSSDDDICVYPAGVKAKIRGIQVHDEQVDTAYAGQRIAINLSNIKTGELRRGHVLARTGALKSSRFLDVKLNIVGHAQRGLRFWERVRLYLGAAQLLARVVLVDTDVLEAGNSAYAQLRLEETIAVAKGDPFVIRRYSPMETIGGGVVLDPCAPKHAKLSSDQLAMLSAMELGGDTETLRKEQETDELRERTLALLETYHSKHNMSMGVNKEEIRSKLNTGYKKAEFEVFLKAMEAEKLIEIHGGNILSLHGYKASFTPQQLEAKETIEGKLLESGLMPTPIADLISGGTQYTEVLNVLMGKSVVLLDSLTVLHTDFYENAKARAADFISKNGSITVSQFRDIMKSNRKYAMIMLDNFDSQKFTKRLGDVRVLC